MNFLVNVLRETDFSDGCPCGAESMCKDGDCVIWQAADLIEELSLENASLANSVNEACEILRRRRRWIPVTERLPREQETVLTWGKQGVILLDWRHDNNWCCFGDVTHWMKLPEPPKEGEQVESVHK